MRDSALATAALTSVALFSQTADAAALIGDEGPSREEVQQRINALYDRAESDTGTYNATRAMATGARTRVAPASAGGSRLDGPALADVTRQWFDGARARLGPTVPAVLPRGRMPARPARTRPTRPERETAARAVPESPAGYGPGRTPELTAGPGSAPVRELTAGPVAAPPALPAAPRTRPGAALALPAPAVEPRRSPLRASKERSHRKLAEARELLARHAVPRFTPLTGPASRPAEESWFPAPEPALPETGQPAWQYAQPSPATGTTTAFGTAHDFGTPGFDTAPAAVSTAAVPVATGDLGDSGDLGGVASAVGTAGLLDRGQDTKVSRALDFARAQIGRPCVWGAKGPESYDCSSLTQAAWKAAGVALPRSAPDQAGAGTAVPLTDLRPGDLVFFHDDLGHVGLCAGDGMMIHAPGPGARIREESIYYAGEQAVRGAVRPA